MKILYTRGAVVFLVFCSLLIDVMIYGIVVPALPELLQEKFGSPVSLNGLFVAIFGFGVLIGAPSSSYFSDKYTNRKMPMIAGFLIFAGGSLGIAFANSIAVLYISRLVQGIGSGITWSVGLASVIDIYPADMLDTPMGIVYTGLTIGETSGPIINASFAQEQNHTEVSMDSNNNIPKNEQKTCTHPEVPVDSKPNFDSPKSSFRQNVEQIDRQITYWSMIKESRIGLLCLIVIFAYGLIGSVEVVVPVNFSEKGLDSDKIGYSFIALTVASAIGGLLMGYVLESKYMTNKFGPYKKRFVVIMVGNAAAGILNLFLGLSKSIPLSIVFLGLVGFFLGAGNAPIMSALGAHIQNMSKGLSSNSNSKVFSLFNIAFSISAMAMPILSSIIYKATSLFISCLILGLLLAGFTVLSMLYLIFYTKDE
ncbi:hypothetical protein BB560_004246 [Smittium megazygosporum]|uniref:Major facilitator superfamily (MFS) profile domain-containing protein n=1 Tax=Smittium megazygosporum TaxID=133381 RepID=A0A2T9Z9Y0_9FUNG|nr:hypothetical protein BB560_004246 [Smittium megazygosporum]